MQIVINISEAVYSQIKAGLNVKIPSKFVLTVLDAVGNGTPLPKGYGRLIDADKLLEAIEKKSKIPAIQKNADIVNGLCGAVSLIYEAPTVIE